MTQLSLRHGTHVARLRWSVSEPSMVAPMAYSRQWVVDTLRRLGFAQEADEALRVLPDEIDRKQLQEFGDRYGLDSSMLTDRMGGSP
jgi:hypothetical protein